MTKITNALDEIEQEMNFLIGVSASHHYTEVAGKKIIGNVEIIRGELDEK